MVAGHQNIVVGNFSFDSSYPTGGESLTAADLGLRVIDLMLIQSGHKGISCEYDYTNEKVLAYVPGILTGAAGAGTLDDFPLTAGPGVSATTSIGLTAGATTLTLGVMKEVTNTNDLSTITNVRFIAFGV
jgi:hypothetical protein